MDLEGRADAALGPTPTDGRHPWLERIARAGYAARGLIYLLVGALALRTAVGMGGRTDGPRQALRDVADAPWGVALLAVLAIGLTGFALWRCIQGVRDTEGFGNGAKGWLARAGRVASGFIHAGWALLAAKLVIGANSRSGDEDREVRDWTATAMAQPFGRLAIAAIGVGIAVFGLVLIRRAFGDRHARHIAVENMRPATRAAYTAVARAGLTARGILLAIVGAFLLAAAWRYDSAQAGGLGRALDRVLEQPYGGALLAIMAVGVMMFGVYNAFLARFRVIRPQPRG